MYIYDEKEKMYKFDGDFMEFLIDIGVEKTHIINMKNKVLKSDYKSVYQDYAELDSPESNYISLVPLDKVIGTSRGTVGWSVYDNVRTMRRGDREPSRFKSCFSYLNNMSLSELRDSYQKLYYPVHMVYFVDDDEYYLSSDGNHRTLTAMLIGADKIKAYVTNAYCNKLKKLKFEIGKTFEEKYSVSRILCCGNFCDIQFRDEKGIYEIRGYDGKKHDEDMFSFIERIASTIDSEIAIANDIKKYPNIVQNFILKRKSHRIKAYINKKYIDDRNKYIYDFRQQVHWERL